MARDFNPADNGYNEVATRIVEFRTKYPEGSLQPVDPANPFEIRTIGDQTFIVYTAAAYRTPDDPRPGIGVAWEPFPGRTPYTRNSELMNAETSAWGRAIIAVGAADSKKGIASLEEVRNRRAEREASSQNTAVPVDDPQTDPGWLADVKRRIEEITDKDTARKLWTEVTEKTRSGGCTKAQDAGLKAEISARIKELDKAPAVEGTAVSEDAVTELTQNSEVAA